MPSLQVKSRLFKQGNKYEIIQFIVQQTKLAVGIHVAQKPESIFLEDFDDKDLHGDRDEDNVNGLDSENDDDPAIAEFPGKVNKFVEYINSVYFDGELDFRSKDAIKRDLLDEEKQRTNVSDETDDSDDQDGDAKLVTRTMPILRTE